MVALQIVTLRDHLSEFRWVDSLILIRSLLPNLTGGARLVIFSTMAHEHTPSFWRWMKKSAKTITGNNGRQVKPAMVSVLPFSSHHLLTVAPPHR